MAEQLKAEVRTHTRISGIDPGHKRLWIGEEAVNYRDLILAWGAETVRVPVEGDAPEAIFPINDLEDYARFRAAVAGKQRVLLGCEFANDLILGGYQVDLVAPCEQVMPTLLHPAAAAAVQAGLEGLAAGLQVNRGVVVDRHLRTSHANIYALGDCAEVDGLNLLYVMPLMSCARALAQTLAGNPTAVSYGAMPITVKTPVCPLVVSPVPRGMEGVWTVGCAVMPAVACSAMP